MTRRRSSPGVGPVDPQGEPRPPDRPQALHLSEEFGEVVEIDFCGGGAGEVSEGRATVVGRHGDRPSWHIVTCGLSRLPSIIENGRVRRGWETRPHSPGSEREPFPFFRVGGGSSRAFSGSVESRPSAFSLEEVRVLGWVSDGGSSLPLVGLNLPLPCPCARCGTLAPLAPSPEKGI